jgi:DNA polymerase-3 subunit gamma/tau
MSYQVIARKFRPQTFEDIVGQEHVTTTLKNSIQAGRIGHAFLFTGIRGVGKTTAARVLAKALNCVNGPTVDPCNVCDACREITAGTSLDVKEIDGASNRGIDSIRELREGVAFAATRDRNKIYIIDEVHMLTTEAFNALLKTLEEPPPHVVFIFATTEIHKVPATIASRCQVFEFKRISVQSLVDHLGYIARREGIEADPEGLRLIAREADGSLRDACSLMDQVISFAGTTIDQAAVAEVLRTGSRGNLERMLGAVLDEDAAGAFGAFSEAIERGLAARQILRDLSRFLSECLRVRLLGPDAARETGLTEQEIGTMMTLVASRSPEHLATLLNLFVTTADKVADSRSPDLLAQAAIVKASRMSVFSSVAGLVDRLEQISKSAPPSVAPSQQQYSRPAPVAPAASAPRPAPAPQYVQQPPPQQQSSPRPVVTSPSPAQPASNADAWARATADKAPKGSVVEAVARLNESAGLFSESAPANAPAPARREDAGSRMMKHPVVDKALGLFGGDVVSVQAESEDNQ